MPLAVPHYRMLILLWTAAVVSLLSAGAPAQDAAAPPAPQVIADFDTVTEALRPRGSLRLAKAKALDGNRFVRVTDPDDGDPNGQLDFHLPQGTAPQRSAGFSLRIRAVGGAATVRCFAMDNQNRILLQRRLDLQPSEQLDPVTLPWTQWRWGDHTGGPPAEIQWIGLRFEGPLDELQFDDLRLDPPDGKQPPGADGMEWLRRVAFGGADVRMAEADGLLVATDAVDGPQQLTDADLTRILNRMRGARKVVRRLFGDAVRPIDGPTPPAMLIFRRHEGYTGFFESAGREWNVKIGAPTGGGLTVHNLAATTFDPKQGADRPVFLHESVHAVFANDVRLHSGHDQHSWLHEGLASYVQLCVYPGAINRKQLAANFRRPIDPTGRGFFQPLDQVLGRRAPTRHYAQLATLVAYLVERKPEWLATIAKELADGRTAEEALWKCGTTLPALQDEWMKWGAEKVGADADAGVMLPALEEFGPAAEPAPAGRK